MARLAFFFLGAALTVVSSWAIADDKYRPSPRETYDPDTYCAWNRSGLPPAQQKICQDYDKKNGVYKPKWQSLEAADGSVFRIDLNSIALRSTGAVDATVYAVQGEAYDPRNLRRYMFDCQGHYMDLDAMQLTAPVYAPPRSVAGQIADIVCADAQKKRAPK